MHINFGTICYPGAGHRLPGREEGVEDQGPRVLREGDRDPNTWVTQGEGMKVGSGSQVEGLGCLGLPEGNGLDTPSEAGKLSHPVSPTRKAVPLPPVMDTERWVQRRI